MQRQLQEVKARLNVKGMWIPGERRLATVQERMATFEHIATEAGKEGWQPQIIDFWGTHFRPNSHSLKDYSTLDFRDEHGKRKFKSFILSWF